MTRRFALLAALMALAGPAVAHHGWGSYDAAKAFTITAPVEQLEWTNPHAHLYIETKDEKGAIVVWDVELMSLNHLRSYGWTAKTVQVGDIVSATGMYARSGDPLMIASRMKLADGREIAS